MVGTRNQPRTVFVLGAGFSAGLGFPLTRDLLPMVLRRVDGRIKHILIQIIRFHFPHFSANRRSTYPNVEEVLTKIAINEELWSASRPIAGGFKKRHLLQARREILYQVSSLFHERLKTVRNRGWLTSFLDYIHRTKSIVVSFNWDLVLERFLFNEKVDESTYGLGNPRGQPVLLKPHGSLNWYEASIVEKVRRDRLSSLTADLCPPPEYEDILLFRKLRAPKTKVNRRYVPYVVPPTFVKRFDHPLLRKIWLEAILELGQARKVVFVGYSFPEYDHHSDFMFRCGFDNQVQGVLSREGERLKRTGRCEVIVVNRDTEKVLKKRMEKVFRFASGATKRKLRFHRCAVADWIRAGMRGL
jgi:hypothetical protein